MATQFIQSSLDGKQYVLTSSLSGIQATTDSAKIDVSLSCENGLDGEAETFYSSSLYAFDDMVELSDVGSIVEEYFRMRDKVADTISIEFDDVSMQVHFLYCEYSLPDEFNPQKAFFIAAQVQRVHQDSVIAISAVDRGDDTPFTVKAVGHALADDALTVVEKSTLMPFNQTGVACFNVADIIRWALNMTDEEAGADLRDVLYFSIEYAGIQKMCYIVPAPAYLTFTFRNVFNVEEYLDVVGEMVTKTAVSRDVAVCKGRSRQYDRTVERTYQIATEQLTLEEVRIFEQFLASHNVALSLDGHTWPVIITEHTCEPSSADDSLATVQFTWRFADRRPRLFDSLMDGVMPARRKIFDDTFSPEYE